MQNSVLEYFERTVKQFPDKIAVCDQAGQVTFCELQKKAYEIMAQIKSRGNVKKEPVLVYLKKSWQSIAAFLGILYSGNFYTPTDVDFPFKKVDSVIEQLKPRYMITDTEHLLTLRENGMSDEIVINIDDAVQTVGEADCWEAIDTDVVYTLFTSGSTGVPKGVAISHRSIIDYIDWARETYQIGSEARIGNQAPFYFDNSTLDIYLMLSTGATLYIIPDRCFTFPVKLLEYVREKEINFVFWVPSVFVNVANKDLLKQMDCSCLKKILFAGEVMPNKHLNYWRNYIPNALYSNLYGPTEITVDCTYYIVDREFADDEPLPIGVPCRNSDVIILSDEDELITEPDRTGELCVRGSSLAMGYWNNWEKTDEVFVQNPLNSHFPERIYRTGDLVYYNERNEIMFAGRKDFQIKHMGYRIEMGEIETAAGAIDEMSNVCVSYDTSEKKIIFFYQSEQRVSDRDIRKRLAGILPKYMLPAVYVKVDEFCFTANGKIDRKTMLDQYLIEK